MTIDTRQNRPATGPSRLIRASLVLIAIQAACAVFFIADVTTDLLVYLRLGTGIFVSVHLIVEAVASLALFVAIALEIRLVLWLIRRQALLETDLHRAGSAVEAVVVDLFEHWRLTGAEQDVALFVVKGLTISEIAQIRGSSEATVKSHLNAIYRKSGSAGRSDLLATVLDVMMGRRGSGSLATTTSDAIGQISA
jgi:DNA-binding CsgD family transcriptional regulator